MSDFLLVVPAGWTEFPEANELINNGATPPDTIMFQVAQQAWEDIDNFLISAVLLPDGKHVTNAKLILTEAGYRFWVVLA
jgi:hypothetical protein